MRRNRHLIKLTDIYTFLTITYIFHVSNTHTFIQPVFYGSLKRSDTHKHIHPTSTYRHFTCLTHTSQFTCPTYTNFPVYHTLYLSNAHIYPQFTCPTCTHTLKERHKFYVCVCAAGVFQHAGISIHRQRFPSVPELIFHRACVCVYRITESARQWQSERETDSVW